MFGRQGGLGGTTSSSAQTGTALVEFRAGRMNRVGNTVHPDSRKGLVSLVQSPDKLIHFCWEDRANGKVEDDLIVFPDDFEFKKVDQCKTGRVFVLIFKTSSRRMFFWMQEPNTDKDEEYCRRVNDVMNNPPTASTGSSRTSGEGADLQYMLNNMSQQQLMQLFGGVGQMGGLSSLLGSAMIRENSSSRSARTGTPTSSRTSSAAATAATPSTPENSASAIPRAPAAPRPAASKKNSAALSGAGVTLPDLQSCLSALSPEGGRSGRSGNVDLTSALTTSSDVVNQVINDPERVQALASHLPDLGASGTSESTNDKKQQIKETITSPQFQQAMSLFSNALQSGQLGPVVSQFELTSEAVAAANTGDMEQFVKALEKPSKVETKDKTEKMDEDDSSNPSGDGGQSGSGGGGTTTDKKD